MTAEASAVREECFLEVSRNLLQVEEIAEPTPRALSEVVLAAASLAEVGHRRELWEKRAPCVKPAGQSRESFLGALFRGELDVNVPDHVVPEVITHVHLLDLSEFLHLLQDVLRETWRQKKGSGEKTKEREKKTS